MIAARGLGGRGTGSWPSQEGQQEGSGTPCGGISGGKGRGSGLVSSRGHSGLGIHHVDTPSSLQVDPARREGVSVFLGFGPKNPNEEVGIWFLPQIPCEPPLPASPSFPLGAVMRG